MANRPHKGDQALSGSLADRWRPDDQVFHDLTFATRLAAHAEPLRAIQEYLGHADAKTTQIYSHYAPSAHEVQRVDAAFAVAEPESNTGSGPIWGPI
ncbi:MAG TPA: tyrosine-type recombinase/integrase [Solirubrobacteraceae bacterium]